MKINSELRKAIQSVINQHNNTARGHDDKRRAKVTEWVKSHRIGKKAVRLVEMADKNIKESNEILRQLGVQRNYKGYDCADHSLMAKAGLVMECEPVLNESLIFAQLSRDDTATGLKRLKTELGIIWE